MWNVIAWIVVVTARKVLNTKRSYIKRLRFSLSITNPNGRPMLPFDWLNQSSLILARCHKILFSCFLQLRNKFEN